MSFKKHEPQHQCGPMTTVLRTSRELYVPLKLAFHELTAACLLGTGRHRENPQPGPHALPGAMRALGLVMGKPHHRALLMTVSSQRGGTVGGAILAQGVYVCQSMCVNQCD